MLICCSSYTCYSCSCDLCFSPLALLSLTEICVKRLSDSLTLPVLKQATDAVTWAQICVRNEVRALINHLPKQSQPAVSLTIQPIRTNHSSEPWSTSTPDLQSLVKPIYPKTVVCLPLSYLRFNPLVHFP